MPFRPHPDDRSWWTRFAELLRLLDSAPPVGTQLAVIQLDDLAPSPPNKYVACPRRGTHEKLTDCWLCWSDVQQGYAKPRQVLRSWSRRPTSGGPR